MQTFYLDAGGGVDQGGDARVVGGQQVGLEVRVPGHRGQLGAERQVQHRVVRAARRAFRDWIDGQAALWDATPPGRRPIGLSPADRATAYRLADRRTDRKENPTPR